MGRDEEENCVTEVIGSLSPSEKDEYISIGAEIERINKAFDFLRADKELVEARRVVFWGKIRRSRKITEGHIGVDLEHDTVLLSVPEPKRNGSYK